MRSLILVLSLLLCGLGRGEITSETIPQIQVTHTWGDLLKTKPLNVESNRVIFPGTKPTALGKPVPISVWIGIDRDRAARNGAVVLYCLAKGVSFFPPPPEDFGPLRVGVQEPGRPTIAPVVAMTCDWDMVLQPPNFLPRDSSYILFTKLVPLGKPGKYVIHLLPPFNPDTKGMPKIFAKIEVQVSGNPRLPWSPWGASKKEQLRWLPQGGNVPGMTDTYTSMTVCNPVGAIAIPKTPTGFIPYQVAPSLDTPLPQLIPDQPDPQTQLKRVGNNLVVTMSQELEIYFPDDHFLTRWWVNDKPYVPDPNAVDADAPMARALAAHVWNVKEVRFDLDFRPERLGAKKGDKIGVQLLFCPEGWQRCEDQLQQDQVALQAAERDPPPTGISFSSNRVDFIYSGDQGHL